VKRQIERGFMMQTYLREVVSKRLDNIGLNEIREYYAQHQDEFRAEDKVKWQDLFVLAERFKSAAEARQYADALAARAVHGDDFAKLAAEYSMGDSKFRHGAGIGDKPGEIFPQDLEATVLALKPGQVTVKETETGFHVLKVAERTYAGPRPYDEKLQGEIKRKLQAKIYEQETRRLIDSLWKQAQPQIWIDK
jgi:parvulin-like peptidyl-prolyl isomerase